MVPLAILVAVVAVPAIPPVTEPYIVPPTYKLPPIPTPPTTCNAPELVPVEVNAPAKVNVF